MKSELFPKNVQVLLTTAEYVSMGKEMGRTQNELKGLQDRLKQVKADFSAKIAEKEARLNSLSTTISNGYEYREVDCFYSYRAKDGQKDVVRTDTREIIGTETMTKRDFQENLPLDKAQTMAPVEAGPIMQGGPVQEAIYIEYKTEEPGDQIDADNPIPPIAQVGAESTAALGKAINELENEVNKHCGITTQEGEGSVPEPGGTGS